MISEIGHLKKNPYDGKISIHPFPKSVQVSTVIDRFNSKV